MTELEEVHADVKQRIESMMQDQYARYFNSGRGDIMTFLCLPREEEYTKRMSQLVEAMYAIEHILGR